jgi:membrane protease YdiL (CAAX protease family)
VLDDDTRHMFESLLQELAHLPAPWLFVLLALLPAVAEELCFRGAILGAFTARPWLGVLLSSVAFSAMHGALLRALPTVLLGLLAGLLTLRARSVFPAMTLHLWHNGLALIVAAWVGAHDGDVTLSDVGLYDVMPAWVYLVGTCGLMLFARGLWVARRFHSLA